MKVEEWGYTNPVVSYLYGRPPLVWKDMRVQLVVYETGIENVRRVVPEPMEPRTNIVITWVSEFELGTTQGAFKEAAIYVQVKHGGVEGDYEPFLYVNSHLPLTGGREIWGYQKKMADIGLYYEYEAVRGQVNRLGHQIIKALVVPEYEANMAEVPWSTGGVFSLKYIPSAEVDGEALRQLVRYTAWLADTDSACTGCSDQSSSCDGTLGTSCGTANDTRQYQSGACYNTGSNWVCIGWRCTCN